MRPSRLELEGFTAFRKPVSLDLAEADLFALTGPTGSGKTSLIDAMCFALYGSVPRLARSAVEPVISLGAPEARVKLDFTVEGRPYTVARVVRKTKTGATTAEARLEGGPEVVSGADEVTAAVAVLLGLGFDHFTKSVVLPQGEFAAFLHDRPADRQSLLRKLLDLDVYRRMAELANDRKKEAEREAEFLERQIAEMADATEEAEAEAKDRLAELVDVRAMVEEALPELEALAAKRREAVAEAEAETDRAGLLAAVVVPEEVPELADRVRAAREELETAEKAEEAARGELDAAELLLSDLPSSTEMEETLSLHARRADLEERRRKGEAVVAEARAAAGESRTRLQEAGDSVEAARRRLARVEHAHAAHVVAAELVVGAPCPVCLREVTAIPEREPPPDLDRSRRAVEEAEERRASADRESAAARRHLDACEVRLQQVAADLAEVAGGLAGRPSAQESEAIRARIREVSAAVDRGRAEQRAARERAAAARRAFDVALESETAARRAFSEARDAVAALRPPAPGLVDLGADWRALAGWALDQAEEARRRAAAATERATGIGRELDDRRRRVLDTVRGAGVELDEAALGEAVRVAVEGAERHLQSIRERRGKAESLRAEARQRRLRADLAGTMARHLSARGFEAWLMEEALTALVAGANGLLGILAEGAYSLDLMRREFVVVDHRNADERRSARTLSGGETFLVSLALALSLSEQLTALSAAGAAKLEAIFLDEGFGTLDGETLDTVSAVIHELGASGRMVGVVSHVKELADQVPIRFEVRRTPGGATVDKVVT